MRITIIRMSTLCQVRHLTYLFVVIGLALLNALANGVVSLTELLVVNATIVGTVAVLESAAFSGRETSRRVLYDRLDRRLAGL